jgi:hypothetical protein
MAPVPKNETFPTQAASRLEQRFRRLAQAPALTSPLSPPNSYLLPCERHHLRELLKTGISVSGREGPPRSRSILVSSIETIGWSVANFDVHVADKSRKKMELP